MDHPLCEECTDTLLDHLDTQLNITENECQNYKQVKLIHLSAGVQSKILEICLSHSLSHTDTHAPTHPGLVATLKADIFSVDCKCLPSFCCQ